MVDPDVEAVAEALWQEDAIRATSRKRLVPWTECGVGEQNKFRGLTEAAMAALRALGWRKVEEGHFVLLADDVQCPRPVNTSPDDTTVAQCIGAGDCGCLYGPLLNRAMIVAGTREEEKM